MKESRYHNPKMAVYCQEVRRLEDKFDGLELNHIPRWLNEAANKLAKMASARESVSTSVFASDQHQPLIRYKEPEQADNGLPISGSGARANNQHPALGSGPNPPTTHLTLRSWKSTKIHQQCPTPWQTRGSRILTA
jgi:hypothetical protein